MLEERDVSPWVRVFRLTARVPVCRSGTPRCGLRPRDRRSGHGKLTVPWHEGEDGIGLDPIPYKSGPFSVVEGCPRFRVSVGVESRVQREWTVTE